MSRASEHLKRRRGAIFAVLLLCVLILLTLSGCAEVQRYSVTYADLFDTVTTFTAYTASRAEFDALAEQVHARLLEEHRRFDIYREYPGTVNLCTVNRLAPSEAVAVDGELMALLRFGKEMYALSQGKLNIAMGAVLTLWQEAREQAAEGASAAAPPEAELRLAAEHCSISDLELNEEAGTVRFLDPQLRLDVGAIAKGWAQARAMELLDASGCQSWLLNMGGSVSCKGVKPGGKLWTIGLEDPLDKSAPMRSFPLADSCAVTSGVDQRYFMVGDNRYHHLIDPDTLYPGTRYTQVTVLLPDPGTADALSTALFLLDRDTGEALASQLGAEVCWVTADGSTDLTDGFPHLN